MDDTEKRKKILRYRRVQSRYKMAKIDSNDNLDDIQAKMDEIEKKEKEKEKEKKEKKEKEAKEKEAEKNKDKNDKKDDNTNGNDDDSDNSVNIIDDDVIIHGSDDEKGGIYSSDEGLDRIALTDAVE